MYANFGIPCSFSKLVLTLDTRSNTTALINGGRAGLFWSYVWTFFGFGFVIFSLAEMSSMLVISRPFTSVRAERLGLPYRADNSTGYRNSRLSVTKSFGVI